MENKNSSAESGQLKPSNVQTRKRVMIAGVGNIFMRDDGFGAAVIKKISAKDLQEGVEIKDFGTGGLKLAYDLMKGYDSLILLDASARGEKPGTLYLIEPSENDFSADLQEGGPIDPHGADPVTILRFVKSMGAWPGKVLVVACEPESVEHFEIGLSEPVNAAVDKAVEMVEDLLKEIYSAK